MAWQRIPRRHSVGSARKALTTAGGRLKTAVADAVAPDGGSGESGRCARVAGRVAGKEANGPVEAAGAAAQGEAGWSFVLAIAALVVIHAVGFWRDWIKSGLFRTATPNTEMFRPYGRLVVLHLTVLLGAFGLAAVGAPVWTMALLCLGKMALELGGVLGVGLMARGPVDRST